jgi:predicted CXXCH cytochrome family protein
MIAAALAILLTATLALLLAPREAQSLIPSHTNCNFCHDMHGAAGLGLMTAPTAEAVCLSCHGPGGISTLKADVHLNGRNSNYPVFRITCIQCHESHNNQPNWLGGTNIKTVGDDITSGGTTFARINTPNSGIREVVFESRGSDAGQPTLHSFADGDEDEGGNGYYDGVCETCHTLTRHHRNNNLGGDHTHHVGATCTRCHAHVDNFIQ